MDSLRPLIPAWLDQQSAIQCRRQRLPEHLNPCVGIGKGQRVLHSLCVRSRVGNSGFFAKPIGIEFNREPREMAQKTYSEVSVASPIRSVHGNLTAWL